MSISQSILDLLFPRRSITGEEGAWITPEELQKLAVQPILLDYETLAKRGIENLDAVVCTGTLPVSPLLRRAIHTFKYRGMEEIGTTLASVMQQALITLKIPAGETPILCPVPLHWTRRFQRGFNQSEILAKALSKTTGFEYRNLLTRTRSTGHQMERTRAERLTALSNAFAEKSAESHTPTCVILVDDVCTTGATLDECAKALRAGGTKSVYGLTAAYG